MALSNRCRIEFAYRDATVALLLAIDARFGRDSLAKWRPAQRLSFALLALVGLVMVSAATRMSLYVASFGLSIDRILAFAVMTWLAMVCTWFGATVLTGRSRQFVIGAVASAGGGCGESGQVSRRSSR